MPPVALIKSVCPQGQEFFVIENGSMNQVLEEEFRVFFNPSLKSMDLWQSIRADYIQYCDRDSIVKSVLVMFSGDDINTIEFYQPDDAALYFNVNLWQEYYYQPIFRYNTFNKCNVWLVNY